MRTLKISAGFAFAALSLAAADIAEAQQRQRSSQQRIPQGQLQVDEVSITGGRLVITGRTAKPNQVVVVVGSGDKTASLPSRRFSFALSYLPDTCKIDIKVEDDELKDLLVAGCALRGKDGVIGRDGRDGKDGLAGKDGASGKDGRDGKDAVAGKDGRDGFVYGSLPGDGTTFRCWTSDIVGLWFIRDYPAPNSRTIAHISPDRVSGGNKLNVTEPGDPLKTERPDGPGVTQWAEFDQNKIYILNRESNRREGAHGDIAADCKSIVWKADGGSTLRTWER